MSNWLALLPGYSALAKRLEAEYNTRTHQLQVDNGVFLARADGLEQDVERLARQNEMYSETIVELNEELRRLKKPVQERGHVDEAPMATNDTQGSPEAQIVRNTRQRKGTARQEH